MALGNNNPLTQKATGMLGETLVFKNYNGKTVITKKPAPSSKPPSPKQMRCRCIFKVASLMAAQLLSDPVQLERYIALAKSRQSSNALTAARGDALRTIYANPSDYEEAIAQALKDYRPSLPKINSEGAAPVKSLTSPATIIETPPASAGTIDTPVFDSNQLKQQLSDMTKALNHCLHELQTTMAKATDLLQAINALNTSAMENRENTKSEEGTINDSTFTSEINPAFEQAAFNTVTFTSEMTMHAPESNNTNSSAASSPLFETGTTANVTDQRPGAPETSSTTGVRVNDFQRYYFPFPGMQQHLSAGMLDKIAIMIQRNAPGGTG
ncbi:hypothetical protein WBG78_29695 [Chryseolinea sp. T2]|uniref:hypothetical protein n=1 Tax=Chryseolinea sp. T2 TaxID=3129255 RepID=UPI0030787EA7